MKTLTGQFGVLDQKFLARSLGTLDPRTPICIPETSDLRQVLETLKVNRIGCVLVTAPNGKLSGIFTERDVLVKLALDNCDYTTSHVSEVMTRNPETARMTTSVAFALNMMAHGGYRHVPIVDDDHLPVGIVSVKDIVDFLANAAMGDLTNFVEHRPGA